MDLHSRTGRDADAAVILSIGGGDITSHGK